MISDNPRIYNRMLNCRLSISDLLIVCSRRADALPTSWITTYTPRPFMMAEVWMQPSGSSEATSCLRNTFGTIHCSAGTCSEVPVFCQFSSHLHLCRMCLWKWFARMAFCGLSTIAVFMSFVLHTHLAAAVCAHATSLQEICPPPTQSRIGGRILII